MNDLAIISILFNYPQHYRPIYFRKLESEIGSSNFFTLHYFDENYGIKEESYYYKFTFYRIKLFYEYLQKNILGKYKYFLLTDATDVGYVENFNNWKSTLEYYNTEILFGGEKFLWPNTDFSYKYKEKNIDTEFKYLNAGVVLANVESYIRHLKSILERKLDGLCDQGNWQIEYLLTNNIQLDYDNVLVLNTFNAKDMVNIENERVIFKKNTPIFVHDNGGYNNETVKLATYFI